jgi:hypothetical protein
MNALELADTLEQGHWEGGTRERAAAMLRQLKAENDALRKTVDSLFLGMESSIELNKAQTLRNEK